MLDFRKIKKKKKMEWRKNMLDFRKILKKEKEWRNLYKRPHKISLRLSQINSVFLHVNGLLALKYQIFSGIVYL